MTSKLADVLLEMIDRFETLPAPPEDGQPRIYLPCETCRTILTVPSNTVSVECSACYGPGASHFNAPNLYE